MNSTASKSQLSSALVLHQIYLLRRGRNQHYSLSSFARDIGVSVSVLSRALSGKRPVSLKFALQVNSVLELDPRTQKSLVASVLRSSTPTSKIAKKLKARLEAEVAEVAPPPVQKFSLAKFNQLQQWYHLAILNYLRLHNASHEPFVIATAFDLPVASVEESLSAMLSMGLIKHVKGRYVRTAKRFDVGTAASHASVRSFHRQMIQKALESLQEESSVSFARRSITGLTIACGEEHLETLKEKISQFQNEVSEYLEKSTFAADRIYQLNTQLIPLTQTHPTPQKRKI